MCSTAVLQQLPSTCSRHLEVTGSRPKKETYSDNVWQMQVDNAFDVRPGRVDGRVEHEAGDVHTEVRRSGDKKQPDV